MFIQYSQNLENYRYEKSTKINLKNPRNINFSSWNKSSATIFVSCRNCCLDPGSEEEIEMSPRRNAAKGHSKRPRPGLAKMKLRSYTKSRKCSCVLVPAMFRRPITAIRSHEVMMNSAVITSDAVTVPIHALPVCRLSDQIYLDFIESGGLFNSFSLDITFETLKLVLDLGYTGTCQITGDNLVELLQSGRKLGIQYLENLCGQFLLDNLSIENAVQTLHIIQPNLCEHRLALVYRFIRINFPEIMRDRSSQVFYNCIFRLLRP